MVAASKLPVSTNPGAMEMAEAMFGDSIKIVSASYSGDPTSAGIYTDGLKVAPGVVPSDTGVILSTGKAENFTNATGEANQRADLSADTQGIDNDAGLNKIAGAETFDAAVFEADFIPAGSVLTMQITFSSEEYLEYVGSGFNDAVGVWVNGVPATLSVGDGDISINNINPTTNGALYVDNANDEFNTELDGFTVVLTLKAPVIAGKVNTIKIGIADGGDASYDSSLLIAGDSIQTAVVAVADEFSMGASDKQVIDLTGNDLNAEGGALTISKINGQAVVQGSVVTLPSGLQIIVNGDGTITLVSDPADAMGDQSFSYEVKNAAGVTDTGLVTGEIVPCFVAGCRIVTARGLVPVEEVLAGDLVATLTSGMQPVLWAGRQTVPSVGAMAAVIIPANRFGNHGAMRVSPQHRLHFSGQRALIYCGASDVLVRVIHLVRAGLLTQDRSGQPVTYCHLLFDRHQIICGEGLWSESYHPGARSLASHDAATRQELLALFPGLERHPAAGYGPIAHPEATSCAARLLFA